MFHDVVGCCHDSLSCQAEITPYIEHSKHVIQSKHIHNQKTNTNCSKKKESHQVVQ